MLQHILFFLYIGRHRMLRWKNIRFRKKDSACMTSTCTLRSASSYHYHYHLYFGVYNYIIIVYSQPEFFLAAASDHANAHCQLVVSLRALHLCDGYSLIYSNWLFTLHSNYISQWCGVITRGVRCLLLT